MNKSLMTLMVCVLPVYIGAQDLSEGLIVNDLMLHPMQDIEKPEYLNEIIDPSFGTTIRRISNSGIGGIIVPMYSTIQAWNQNESMMILYNQSTGYHELLDGITYQFIRVLDDIDPVDLEQIFWDFEESDIFYYHDYQSNDFIRYSVSTQTKQPLLNLAAVSNCDGNLSMGNDIQMMSWDSDVFTFRCDNETAFAFRISTNELTVFNIEDLYDTAPAVAPSGSRFYHESLVYNSLGNSSLDLNESAVEHSCIGSLSNGNDAYFTIAFSEGPEGGCIGDIIAHDLTTGLCFPVISESQGYEYPQSGTHISSLAHKNTEGGWVAASMIGYDQDGQSLLDQELIIAKAEEGNIKVCRIGHHRSDEDQFDYWGEPHPVISPTGTRVLFASDWSGSADGQSIDSYVVELPAFSSTVPTIESNPTRSDYKVFPNPIDENSIIEFDNPNNKQMTVRIYNSTGKELTSDNIHSSQYKISTEKLCSGLYFFSITNFSDYSIKGKFIK